LIWTGSYLPQQSADLNQWIERPDIQSPWRPGTAGRREFFRLVP